MLAELIGHRKNVPKASYRQLHRHDRSSPVISGDGKYPQYGDFQNISCAPVTRSEMDDYCRELSLRKDIIYCPSLILLL